MRIVALAAILLLVGGCLEVLAGTDGGPDWAEDESWSRHACDPSKTLGISNNAPREEAFKGPVWKAVDAWSQALGEAPVPTTPSETGEREPSPEPTDSGHWEWGTGRGQFRYEYTLEPNQGRLTYESRHHWTGPAPRQVVEDALRRLALDPAEFETFEGPSLDEPGEYVFIKVLHRVGNQTMGPPVVDAYFGLRAAQDDRLGVRIEMRPAYDVAAEHALSEADALAIATKFFECQDAPMPGQRELRHRPSGIRIVHQSIAYSIDRDDGEGLGCRPVWSVLIDAQTGAVHKYEQTGSICID